MIVLVFLNCKLIDLDHFYFSRIKSRLYPYYKLIIRWLINRNKHCEKENLYLCNGRLKICFLPDMLGITGTIKSFIKTFYIVQELLMGF